MDIARLRVQANQDWADLGPEPADPHERETWATERAASVMLLAEIVDRDTQLLRNAASGEWVATLAQDLLLDAAQECPVAGRARPRGRCNLGTCGPGVSRPAGGTWRERGWSSVPDGGV